METDSQHHPSFHGTTGQAAACAPEWWGSAVDQLSAIGRLPFGWDSHGAAPPTEEAVRAAHFFLGEIARLIDPPRPRINPTPSGGVQFEWEDGQRYLEIEVIGSGSADYYYEDRSEGLIDEGSLPANIPTRDLIERNS